MLEPTYIVALIVLILAIIVAAFNCRHLFTDTRSRVKNISSNQIRGESLFNNGGNNGIVRKSAGSKVGDKRRNNQDSDEEDQMNALSLPKKGGNKGD